MPRKTVGKTGRKTGQFKKGQDARRGVGKKGRSGRKPDEFKEMCRRLVTSAAVLREMGKVLRDCDHPHFMKAVEYLTAYGYGKPTQSVEHEIGQSVLRLAAEAFGGAKA